MSKPGLVVFASVGALLAWLFAPALGGGSSFVFRDAAHFYHPLFEFIRGEWGAGRLPLWNPYENMGMSLAGETTSSVFYPGKLIFALPLDYTLLYNLYIVSHVALAALASFCLARHWGASVLAAGLGAVSYAFSGNVLFQYANVVFLVGAAWLPLALLLADRMLRERNWRAAVCLGVVLALMITGGDPQMAYHAGLLAALAAFILWRSRHHAGNDSGATASSSSSVVSHGGYQSGATAGRVPSGCSSAVPYGRWKLHSATLLAVSATTCFLLAAIQILPAWEAARESGRAAYDSPRNVYELAASIASDKVDDRAPETPWYAGLLDTSPSGHQRHVYEFNVGPWRAIEYVWPNIAGRQFQTHHRWLDALPAEGRVWTPSLYMGLLPLVFALARFSVRRAAPVEVRWLSWMALLSALASLGIYGLVWLIREVAGWFGGSFGGAVGDEVGGLYWLMSVLLPGYVYFRYPAKLLVVTSLGLSMLAARGWDAAWQRPSAGLRRWLFALSAVSVVTLIAARLSWPALCIRLQAMPPNILFGPFDCQAAWTDLAGGLKQTALVAALLAILIGPIRGGASWSWAPLACLVITVFDLAAAQAPLVPYAPAAAWQRTPTAMRGTPSVGQERLALRKYWEEFFLWGYGYRIYRDPTCRPSSWARSISLDRQREGIAWERDTLSPKYNLPYRLPLAEATGTLTRGDIAAFWDVAREHSDSPGGLPHASVLDLVGTSMTLAPPRGAADDWPVAEGVVRKWRSNALPRAWIVHRVESLPVLRSQAPSSVRRRTQEVLFPGGQPRDWRTLAVVESDEKLTFERARGAWETAESCRITAADPERVEIEARLASPGLVVLADAFYPGWQLSVETEGVKRPVPIVRTNRIMRGAALPAGQHRLIYRYRPASVMWGAAISGLTAMGLAIVATFHFARRSHA